MPVVVDWCDSLRRVPPKEAMVAFVSKAILDVILALAAVGEDGADVVKCLASCESLEVKVDVVGECWTFRYLIRLWGGTRLLLRDEDGLIKSVSWTARSPEVYLAGLSGCPLGFIIVSPPLRSSGQAKHVSRSPKITIWLQLRLHDAE